MKKSKLSVAVRGTIAGRIKALRESLGLKQHELAKLVGVNQSNVSKWERGEDEPREPKTLLRLAELAHVPLSQFLGYGAPSKFVPQARMARVVGELQAGAWKEAIEWDFDDQYEERVAFADELPDVPLKAYRIAGPSMNRMFPHGTIVFVAPLSGTGLSPQSGKPVLVSRRNSDGLYEATIKEYVVDGDGSKWLWPRSYDPAHQAPVPYRESKSEEVTISGIVMVATVKVF